MSNYWKCYLQEHKQIKISAINVALFERINQKLALQKYHEMVYEK